MTKLIALAVAALAATAGAALADNTFALDRARSTASSIALTNVQADTSGTLEVYSYDADGSLGSLLGIAAVTPGTAGDVEVALNQPSRGRFLVLMSNGNRAVARLDVRNALTN